jgi:hypothetical protein
MFKNATYLQYARNPININHQELSKIISKAHEYEDIFRNLVSTLPGKNHVINNHRCKLQNITNPQVMDHEYVLKKGPQLLEDSKKLILELSDYIHHAGSSLFKRAFLIRRILK